MKAYALVDYDNLAHQDKSGGLISLSRRFYSVARSIDPSVDQLVVRLYGGWYDANGLTQEGTRLTQELAVFPLMVTSIGKIEARLYVEIASAPVDAPSDLLPFTLRQRPGIRSRLKVNLPSQCADQSICSVNHVSKWSKGFCPQPTCTVSARSVFTYQEQKLVDTLLCCDLLAIAIDDKATPILLVSDDDDMVPALLLGKRIGGSVHKLSTKPSRPGIYEPLFQQYGIQSKTF